MKEPMSAEGRRLLEALIELAENDLQQIDWTIRFLKKILAAVPTDGTLADLSRSELGALAAEAMRESRN
jgi:hypothetical protein